MATVPYLARRGAPAEATSELYDRYGAQIFVFCLKRLGSREEAEDAVQSTFLNAFRGLKRGVAPANESAWLFKIAHNVCRTRRRSIWRRGRVEAPTDLELLHELVPAPEPVYADELIPLQQALEAMPASQRRAILLREWQGLSYSEIGELLGLSQPAVEALIFRARRTLASGLEDGSTRPRLGRLRHALDAGWLAAALKTLLGGGAAAKAVATAAVVATATVVAAGPLTPERERAAEPARPVPERAAPAARRRATVVDVPRVIQRRPATVRVVRVEPAVEKPRSRRAAPPRRAVRPAAKSPAPQAASVPSAAAEPTPAPPPAPEVRAPEAPAPQPAAPAEQAAERSDTPSGNANGHAKQEERGERGLGNEKPKKHDARPPPASPPAEPQAPPAPVVEPAQPPPVPAQAEEADRNNGNGNDKAKEKDKDATG